MVRPISSDTSSLLLRQQIANLAARMREITATTLLMPLKTRMTYNGLKRRFAKAQYEAYQSCSDIEQADSIGAEEQARNTAHMSMSTMVDIKEEAGDVAANDTRTHNRETRF